MWNIKIDALKTEYELDSGRGTPLVQRRLLDIMANLKYHQGNFLSTFRAASLNQVVDVFVNLR